MSALQAPLHFARSVRARVSLARSPSLASRSLAVCSLARLSPLDHLSLTRSSRFLYVGTLPLRLGGERELQVRLPPQKCQPLYCQRFKSNKCILLRMLYHCSQFFFPTIQSEPDQVAIWLGLGLPGIRHVGPNVQETSEYHIHPIASARLFDYSS